MAAILDVSKVFVQCEIQMTRVHSKIKATKRAEYIFKFMLINSESGRFFLIYINEVGELFKWLINS